MTVSVNTTVTTAVFPAGTQDTPYTVAVNGVLADGTVFSQNFTGPGLPISFVLDPGSFTATVSKNGVSSLVSPLFTVPTAQTVTLTVPDSTQAPVVTIA